MIKANGVRQNQNVEKCSICLPQQGNGVIVYYDSLKSILDAER